ncbi:MAG: RNA polymerase sigma factor [Solirubrobacteraceae bacterium]
MLRFLTYRTGDGVLAEDLVAETFERILRTRWRFDPRRGSEKTWVYTMALSCLRDHGRRRSAENRAMERSLAAGMPADSGGWEANVEDRDVLGRAMDTLNADERECIALRYGADLSIPEIARVLRQSQTTVHGRVYRGLRKLREEFE